MSGISDCGNGFNHATATQSVLRACFLQYLLTRGIGGTRDENRGAQVSLAVQGIDDLEVFLARDFLQTMVTALVPAMARFPCVGGSCTLSVIRPEPGLLAWWSILSQRDNRKRGRVRGASP